MPKYSIIAVTPILIEGKISGYTAICLDHATNDDVELMTNITEYTTAYKHFEQQIGEIDQQSEHNYF